MTDTCACIREVLRSFADRLERLAFAIPAPNVHTPQLVELAIAMRAAAVAAQAPRPCTCHPDDRPDGPCREKYASNECLAAALDALQKQMESQKDEWLSWQAKREALEKDAARYRWLRKRWARLDESYADGGPKITSLRVLTDQEVKDGCGWDVDPASLDRAIDAAMKEEGHG